MGQAKLRGSREQRVQQAKRYIVRSSVLELMGLHRTLDELHEEYNRAWRSLDEGRRQQTLERLAGLARMLHENWETLGDAQNYNNWKLAALFPGAPDVPRRIRYSIQRVKQLSAAIKAAGGLPEDELVRIQLEASDANQ